MNIPTVHDEFETIAAVLEGKNLARLGDGEAKLIGGAGYVREPGGSKIASELFRVLTSPHPQCLVGIPTFDPRGPKAKSWENYRARFEAVLSPAVEYYSAFVTRPDSAPWIRTADYAQSVESLWQGRHAVVVCEPRGSMLGAVWRAARRTQHIECPRHEAYAHIDELEARVREARPDIAILSAGPTATCLANRLAKHGIHAVDLGSAGKFLAALLVQ